MDLQEHVILINGANKTFQVESIRPDGYKYAVKFKNTNKVYLYHNDKITWLTNPVSVDFTNCHVFINGKRQRSITQIHFFNSDHQKYYAITFNSGFTKHYTDDEVDIRQSCLTGDATDVFDYMRQCAGVNTLGIADEDDSSQGILSSIYSRIDFVDNKTAAKVYLKPSQGFRTGCVDTPLFPFGCNSSQGKAVKVALSNQISVIQGPPGTGKTQTILNIIANLLIARKSVLIVSNNNSATENVLEKLANNGLDFLVAPLGKRENRDAFVANQPPLNPDLPSWSKTTKEIKLMTSKVESILEQVESVFGLQERLAVCRQELAEVEIEKKHFEQEHSLDFTTNGASISSAKVLNILGKVKHIMLDQSENNPGLWARIKKVIRKLDVELRLRFMLRIKSDLDAETIPDIITLLDWIFYHRRLDELTAEIDNIEKKLSQLDAQALLKSLTETSMTILKSVIAKRYNKPRTIIASTQDLFNNGEAVLEDYPIVLSTTFSSRMCFNSDTLFDYVIMDEASQVSVDTGLLALTCAKNAVIVGDTMQLPNVVTQEDADKLDAIRKYSNISDTYDAGRHSFLSSVLATIADVPVTLLREHYRCHPDIINFCNQKFYGGNLLIMTKRKDNEKHLIVLTTAKGQHSRGHYNQREIDAVRVEIMPMVDNLEETGIIAPYNRQVDQFHAQIPEIEVATVHKYQGREKETIILSVTDDIITEFSDNANLLNVAVSRAKNKFCLVVTGNPQVLKGNIHDLMGYINYQQGVVIQSKLRSIYDYLFSKIEFHRTVSKYNSENLTFELIENIRTTYPQLSHIKVLCHYPVRSLIRDTAGLSEREAKYATHPSTHIDFLIINRVSKEPLLAIETDGYKYHNDNTEQFQRDKMKDHILELFGLPLLRLSTVGHSEQDRIIEALTEKYTHND